MPHYQPRKFRPPVRALIGTDFAEFARKTGEALEKDNDRRLAEAKEFAEKTVYEGPQRYYVLVRGGENGSAVTVETIDKLPGVGVIKATGANYARAVTNLRVKYAEALHKKKLITDWDQCREAASRATFVPALGE